MSKTVEVKIYIKNINKKKKFVFEMSEEKYNELLIELNFSSQGKTYPTITIGPITFLKSNLLYIEKN